MHKIQGCQNRGGGKCSLSLFFHLMTEIPTSKTFSFKDLGLLIAPPPIFSDLPTALRVRTFEVRPPLVFWPCQWNLIKTFQTEVNTPLITKMAFKIFLNIFGRSQIAKFWLSKSFFYVKNYPILSKQNFSLEKINIRAQLL